MTMPLPRTALMTFERSRCCVMRCNRSACRRCAEACSQGAITFTPSFSLSAEQCSGCLRCTAACPTGALTARGMEHPDIFDILANIANPVLGCGTRPDSRGHVRVPCFGGCDEAWLLALLLALPDPIQLNMTACAACRNGAIVADIKDRLKNIEARTRLPAFKTIRLVEQQSDLRFEAVQFDRRRFFRAFGTKVLQDIRQGMPSQLLHYGTLAYNHKTAPFARQSLNRRLSAASAKCAQKILTDYYYTVECSARCTMCAACVAICPTGALEQLPEEHRLRFDSTRCAGCAVCAEFCRQGAIQVKTGWFRDSLSPIQL